MYFAIFLRITFYGTPSGDCFWVQGCNKLKHCFFSIKLWILLTLSTISCNILYKFKNCKFWILKLNHLTPSGLNQQPREFWSQKLFYCMLTLQILYQYISIGSLEIHHFQSIQHLIKSAIYKCLNMYMHIYM